MHQSEDEDSLTMCCGGKKCPVITQKADGFVLTDEGQRIPLSDEQVALLVPWLEKRLRVPAAAE